MDMTGDSRFLVSTANFLEATETDFSTVVEFTPETQTSTGSLHIQHYDGMGLRLLNTGKLSIRWDDSNPGAVNISSANVIPVGVDYQAVHRADDDNAGTIHFKTRLNGIEEVNASLSSTGIIANWQNNWGLGARSPDGSYAFIGKIRTFAIFERTLTDSEADKFEAMR